MPTLPSVVTGTAVSEGPLAWVEEAIFEPEDVVSLLARTEVTLDPMIAAELL